MDNTKGRVANGLGLACVRSARDLQSLRGRQKGFTLIEVMIVVAIIAILVGVGVPAYNSYMQKTRRADAVVTLTEVAGEQQRFYTENNRYADNMTEMGYQAEAIDSENGFYTLSVTASSSSSYTITAAPASGGPQESDGECGSFTINSAGVKGVENASKTAQECW